MSGDAFGDGAGGDKYLIDLSAELSQIYGNLVRQGQVFTVRQVNVRMYNPNTAVQDQHMAVSGKLVYFAPTAARKKAWKSAFQAWRMNRRQLGIKTRNEDFRVGFVDGYKVNQSILGILPGFLGLHPDGVAYNAWINDEEKPLLLSASNDTQDIFGNWSQANMSHGPDADNTHFGHWAAKDASSLADDLDFVAGEYAYFNQDEASTTAQSIPFQVGFSSWWRDDSGSTPANPLATDPISLRDFQSVSNADAVTGPFPVMCGLLGVYVDTTTVDDSTAQTADWGIEISIDVEKWSPIMKRRKGGKK